DPQSPFITSGIRVGTPAATTRGFDEDDMRKIGKLIKLTATEFDSKADDIRAEVTRLCEKHQLYK
ncbi:MAG: serine hydroxymethyltransferase, partial [Firmicutes bacterium]|nr:serine hydroxymethyltransferase [Bacillota bacterium]